MSHLINRLPLYLFLVLGSFLFTGRSAISAGAIEWADPMKIAGPGYVNYPDLVVDQQGRVHFFYSQGTSINSQDNAIYYRIFDGEQLSPPIDVLITPGIMDARTPSVVIDESGIIHVVWVGGTNIWYSQAPITNTGNATAWTKPILLDGPTASNTRPALQVTDNSLRLAYILYGNNPGIYVLASENGGSIWGSPVSVANPKKEGLSPVSLDMCIDDGERMHIVWYEGDISSRGLAAQDIYYINQSGAINSWSGAALFDSVSNGNYEGQYGPSMPSIACRDSEIYIYWYGAPMGQRHFRFSSDAGQSWLDFGRITEFRGLTYPAGLAFDRNGSLYAASGSLDNRLMFMVMDGYSWSEVNPIDINSMGPHYPRMVSFNGQILHVIWQEVMSNEIWYREGKIISVPELPNFMTTPVNVDPTALPPTVLPSSVLPLEEIDTPLSTPMIAGDSHPINFSPNSTILLSSACGLLILIIGFVISRNKLGR